MVCGFSALPFSMNIVIHGYTGALQEGDNLTLTCESDSHLIRGWIFTPNGKAPKLISQNRTFHKYDTELSDAGEYTCTPYGVHREAYAYYDLTASVRVEVLKSVTDNSNSVEVITHNIIIGGGTTNTSVADNRSTVEVFTHNIIIGGSATAVIIFVIIVALVIALV